MLRGMVFVDHMNFNIALQSYYKSLNKLTPKLDYNMLFREVVKLIPNVDYLKTFIFAPKPDDFLMNDSYLKGYYKWLSGLSSAQYIDVIEGRYLARPTSSAPNTMNISDHSTYYKVEKGTDINLAVHALSKAHFNSYDVAFVMSADTDYISVYKLLKSIGKIVVIGVTGQNLGKIIPEVDDYKFLDDAFFQNCLRI